MSQVITTHEAGKCMKCGFCMSSCPIYTVDHIESHVARGRNVLIKRAGEGSIPEDEAYAERLSYCLLCGRCETTCPAKVPSPDITIAARMGMVGKRGLSWRQRLVYRGILGKPRLMARLLGLASLVPGFSVRSGKPLRHLPDLASALTGGLSIPKLSRPFLSDRLKSRTNPPEGAKVQGRIAVFPGCASEFFFADAGEQMVLALADAGFEVVHPKGLTCCGVAVRNAGDLSTAQQMARHNIEILSGFDRIVTGCATCISALKDYADWFPGDEHWTRRAGDLSARIRDFSQFLVSESAAPLCDLGETTRTGGRPQLVEPVTVTYHDPCHLKWHQGISAEPRRLLRSIEGVEFIEMEGADECCGLGGAFSINHREVSLAIQERKMQSIKKTGAQVVVTSCPGCMIQLMDGVRRHGLSVEVMHISQLIRGQKGRPRKPR